TEASTNSEPNVFAIEIYDGNTGLKVNTVEGITVKVREWRQFQSVLAQYGNGTTQGYAHIKRTSGANRFVAYAVMNDGGQPGQRTGDGAFVVSVDDSGTASPRM